MLSLQKKRFLRSISDHPAGAVVHLPKSDDHLVPARATNVNPDFFLQKARGTSAILKIEYGFRV